FSDAVGGCLRSDNMERRSAVQTIVASTFAGIGSSDSKAQSTRYTRALILGGGSIKGAYQAGVIDTLFKNGFRPDYLYGISAGSGKASFRTPHASFTRKDKRE